MTRKSEYKLLLGHPKKLNDIENEINGLASEGWEIHDLAACSAGGFGFGLAVGSGLGGGGMMSAFVVVMRRQK